MSTRATERYSTTTVFSPCAKIRIRFSFLTRWAGQTRPERCSRPIERVHDLHDLARKRMQEAKIRKLGGFRRLRLAKLGGELAKGGDLESVAVGGEIFQEGAHATAHHSVG